MVYADAAYASKATRRRSVSGRTVMCRGEAIQWAFRTQKIDKLSTSEAEYVAGVEVFKEDLFRRSAWRFILPDFGDPFIQAFEDNTGVIQVGVNPVANSNSNQLDVWHYFLRKRSSRESVKSRTRSQKTNMLTSRRNPSLRTLPAFTGTSL